MPVPKNETETCPIQPVEKVNIFDQKVRELDEAGLYRGMDDAKKPLRFRITKQHVQVAKCGDEAACVIAQAISEALPGEVYVSIGVSVSKVLMYGEGRVYRYLTPVRLRQGLNRFDERKDWGLPEGTYHLKVPRDSCKLMKNMSEEARKRKNRHWDEFNQKFKKDGPNGRGMTKHRGVSLPVRQITVLRKVEPSKVKKSK